MLRLVGIQIGLQHLYQEKVTEKHIMFLNDSLPALNMSFTNGLAKDYTYLVKSNRKLIRQLKDNQNDICGAWIPGHSNFLGNEIADNAAKEGAANATTLSNTTDRKVLMMQLLRRKFSTTGNSELILMVYVSMFRVRVTYQWGGVAPPNFIRPKITFLLMLA